MKTTPKVPFKISWWIFKKYLLKNAKKLISGHFSNLQEFAKDPFLFFQVASQILFFDHWFKLIKWVSKYEILIMIFSYEMLSGEKPFLCISSKNLNLRNLLSKSIGWFESNHICYETLFNEDIDFNSYSWIFHEVDYGNLNFCLFEWYQKCCWGPKHDFDSERLREPHCRDSE